MFALNFKVFEPTDKNLTSVYTDDAYTDPFVIRISGDRFFTVQLKWQQGTGLNYYFETVYGHLIDPSQVTHIQVKQVTL